MPPLLYRIVNSRALDERFRAIRTTAETEGRDGEVMRAMQKILIALQIRPASEGESFGELPASKMALRRVLEKPITVEFAVNEKDRVVFLRYIHLWPK